MAYRRKDIALDPNGVAADRSTGEEFQIAATGGVYVDDAPDTFNSSPVWIYFDSDADPVRLVKGRAIDAKFERFRIEHAAAHAGTLRLVTFEKGEGIYDTPFAKAAAADLRYQERAWNDPYHTAVGANCQWGARFRGGYETVGIGNHQGFMAGTQQYDGQPAPAMVLKGKSHVAEIRGGTMLRCVGQAVPIFERTPGRFLSDAGRACSVWRFVLAWSHIGNGVNPRADSGITLVQANAPAGNPYVAAHNAIYVGGQAHNGIHFGLNPASQFGYWVREAGANKTNGLLNLPGGVASLLAGVAFELRVLAATASRNARMILKADGVTIFSADWGVAGSPLPDNTAGGAINQAGWFVTLVNRDADAGRPLMYLYDATYSVGPDNPDT